MDMHDIEDFIDEWFEAGNVPTKEMDRNLCWELACQSGAPITSIASRIADLPTIVLLTVSDPNYWTGLCKSLRAEMDNLISQNRYQSESKLRLIYSAIRPEFNDISSQDYVNTAYLADESGISVETIMEIFSKYLKIKSKLL
jgi:hypothetical protein